MAAFHDPELAALARIGEGRCLIYLDRVDEGVALLDEGMVAIEANDVPAIAIGDAYCPAIEGCTELFDVRRAHTWTAALSRWVDGQPELLLYRGQCLIHRAEMLYLRGDWDAAADQIEEAYRRLADPVGQRSRGAAAYLKGDLHRLRGQDRAAEAEFQLASELGRDPQPGLALLRLATGKVEAAAASIRRAYHEAGRTRLLIAAACRAVGDDDSAEMELGGAIPVFDRLNAVRDAAAARAS